MLVGTYYGKKVNNDTDLYFDGVITGYIYVVWKGGPVKLPPEFVQTITKRGYYAYIPDNFGVATLDLSILVPKVTYMSAQFAGYFILVDKDIDITRDLEWAREWQSHYLRYY